MGIPCPPGAHKTMLSISHHCLIAHPHIDGAGWTFRTLHRVWNSRPATCRRCLRERLLKD